MRTVSCYIINDRIAMQYYPERGVLPLYPGEQ